MIEFMLMALLLVSGGAVAAMLVLTVALMWRELRDY